MLHSEICVCVLSIHFKRRKLFVCFLCVSEKNNNNGDDEMKFMFINKSSEFWIARNGMGGERRVCACQDDSFVENQRRYLTLAKAHWKGICVVLCILSPSLTSLLSPVGKYGFSIYLFENIYRRKVWNVRANSNKIRKVRGLRSWMLKQLPIGSLLFVLPFCNGIMNNGPSFSELLMTQFGHYEEFSFGAETFSENSRFI